MFVAVGLSSQVLRTSTPPTTPRHMLSAQLSAMELNVLNGHVSGNSLISAPAAFRRFRLTL
jgi:hypothetical protein